MKEFSLRIVTAEDKLLRMIFMQRDVEGDDEKRSQFIQQMAERYGFRS